MKTIMTMAICLFISMQGVALDNKEALTIKGFILETMSIDYEVCLINDDNTCTSIKTEKVFKFYKIILEVGRNYKITFCKGNLSKTLIVNADSRGIFPVDINFTNTNNAHLSYDYNKRQYKLKVLPNDYGTQETTYIHRR